MPCGFEFSASFLLPQPDTPTYLSFEFSYFHPSCSSHGLTFPKHNFYQLIPFEKSIKAPQCLQCKKNLPGLKGLLNPTPGYQQSLLCAFYSRKAVPFFALPQVFQCCSIMEHLLFCPQSNPTPLQGLTSSLVLNQAHPYRFMAAYKQKGLQKGSSQGA